MPRILPADAPETALLVKRGRRAKRYGPFAPKRDGDVGFDQYCVEDTVIPPGIHLAPTEIPVDICVKLPAGTFAVQMLRSSTPRRFPTLLLRQSPIDNGYTGLIGPFFQNLGTEPVLIPAGTALTQLVLFHAVVPAVREVRRLPETERGGKRYGSTGR
jgi:dUTPase